MKTPRDLVAWAVSALLTGLALVIVYVIIRVATDIDNEATDLVVYASWALVGIGALLLVAAAVSKVIQIGVRSAKDD